MQILRGTFSAEPLEKQRLSPMFSKRILRQKARLHGLVRTGKAPKLTKYQARKLCDQAAKTTPITRV